MAVNDPYFEETITKYQDKYIKDEAKGLGYISDDDIYIYIYTHETTINILS